MHRDKTGQSGTCPFLVRGHLAGQNGTHPLKGCPLSRVPQDLNRRAEGNASDLVVRSRLSPHRRRGIRSSGRAGLKGEMPQLRLLERKAPSFLVLFGYGDHAAHMALVASCTRRPACKRRIHPHGKAYGACRNNPSRADGCAARGIWRYASPLCEITECGRRVAACPEDTRSIDDWARSIGMSRRTFTRHFIAGTGSPFCQWEKGNRSQDQFLIS